MATTVHIPDDLLEQIDRRAEAKNMSRNRYIVEALKRTIHEETDWPPEFLERLRQRGQSTELVQGVDEMMAAIASARRSKQKPPQF